MKSSKLLKTVCSFSLVFGTAALASDPGAATYDRLHPYYAEFCAVTQISPKVGDRGGIGGHGVIFIKGTCRDTSHGYPRLRVCNESEVDLNSPEGGASISVDQMFRNVNWVGMDGKALLTTGGTPQDSRLTNAVQEPVIQKVLSERLFDGIEFHEEFLKDRPASMPMEEYVVRQGVGTDFAMNFGRNVYCARLPIAKEMIPSMVDYLNSRNDEYRKTDYNWDGVFNNCTHTTHNALAAAGIFRPYGTDEFIALQAFNLAIPSNEFIDIEELGNDDALNDVIGFYRDKYKREMLLKYDWIATQPGVLTENFSVRQDNDLYSTDSSFLILDLPPFNARHHVFDRINSEARYSDVRANLLAFKKKYEDALDALPEISEITFRNTDGTSERPYEIDTTDFKRFYWKFYSHLEQALADVNAQLGALK